MENYSIKIDDKYKYQHRYYNNKKIYFLDWPKIYIENKIKDHEIEIELFPNETFELRVLSFISSEDILKSTIENLFGLEIIKIIKLKNKLYKIESKTNNLKDINNKDLNDFLNKNLKSFLIKNNLYCDIPNSFFTANDLEVMTEEMEKAYNNFSRNLHVNKVVLDYDLDRFIIKESSNLQRLENASFELDKETYSFLKDRALFYIKDSKDSIYITSFIVMSKVTRILDHESVLLYLSLNKPILKISDKSRDNFNKFLEHLKENNKIIFGIKDLYYFDIEFSILKLNDKLLKRIQVLIRIKKHTSNISYKRCLEDLVSSLYFKDDYRVSFSRETNKYLELSKALRGFNRDKFIMQYSHFISLVWSKDLYDIVAKIDIDDFSIKNTIDILIYSLIKYKKEILC